MRRQAERAHPASKNDSKPECVPKSTTDIAHPLRNRLSAQPLHGKLVSLTDQQFATILLAQDYRGDSKSIQDAAACESLRARWCVAASSPGIAQMLRQDWEGTDADKPDFLVLDLRFQEGKGA